MYFTSSWSPLVREVETSMFAIQNQKLAEYLTFPMKCYVVYDI